MCTALDDYSKKLEVFGERYEKYCVQFLSKIEVAIPDSYQYVLTILNIDAEHKKTANVQLETAKRMIKDHLDNDISKEVIKEGSSMMCMHASNG